MISGDGIMLPDDSKMKEIFSRPEPIDKDGRKFVD